MHTTQYDRQAKHHPHATMGEQSPQQQEHSPLTRLFRDLDLCGFPPRHIVNPSEDAPPCTTWHAAHSCSVSNTLRHPILGLKQFTVRLHTATPCPSHNVAPHPNTVHRGTCPMSMQLGYRYGTTTPTYQRAHICQLKGDHIIVHLWFM